MELIASTEDGNVGKLERGTVALIVLSNNQGDDAVCPLITGDADGRPIHGEGNYPMHLDKDKVPPPEAFWSLTMYDAGRFQVPHPINRFAIGDRDPLKFNSDGSLDLDIQHASPGKDKESNWLPAPAGGVLGTAMPLHAAKATALYGRWAPPPVQRMSGTVDPLPRWHPFSNWSI